MVAEDVKITIEVAMERGLNKLTRIPQGCWSEKYRYAGITRFEPEISGLHICGVIPRRFPGKRFGILFIPEFPVLNLPTIVFREFSVVIECCGKIGR